MGIDSVSYGLGHLAPQRAVYKVAVLGPGGVGKTTLLNQFVYASGEHRPDLTVGIDFCSKRLLITSSLLSSLTSSEDVLIAKLSKALLKIFSGRSESSSFFLERTLSIGDYAGQDQFRTLAPLFIDSSHGVLLCFALNAPTSISRSQLDFWSNLIKKARNPPVLLVGTKCDLGEEIGACDLRELSLRYDNDIFGLFRVSGKKNINVQEVFLALTLKMVLEEITVHAV